MGHAVGLAVGLAMGFTVDIAAELAMGRYGKSSVNICGHDRGTPLVADGNSWVLPADAAGVATTKLSNARPSVGKKTRSVYPLFLTPTMVGA